MRTTNIGLILFNQTISDFADKKLPQKISFAITKNGIVIANELQVYQTQLNKIIESYSTYIEYDVEGKMVMLDNGLPLVDKDHSDDFMKDVTELLNCDVDIDLYKIDETAFDYEDSDRYDPMSASDILRLREILC